MNLYGHCVKYGKLYLLKQWDTEKNSPLTPKSLASTGTLLVWWKCEKGHSWQTELCVRAWGNTGCPICLRERITMRVGKRCIAKAEKAYAPQVEETYTSQAEEACTAQAAETYTAQTKETYQESNIGGKQL